MAIITLKGRLVFFKANKYEPFFKLTNHRVEVGREKYF